MTASGSIKLAPTSLFSCTNTSLLEIELSHAPITTATLEAFSAAWNRHDIDALMSFMTEDCVFMTAAGPDVCGTRHAGTEAVRKAFAGAWGGVPDVQ